MGTQRIYNNGISPLSRSMDLSKRLIATLTLIALISIFLAKFLTELALAAPAEIPRMITLDHPAQVLGTYEVRDVRITNPSYTGPACKPYRVKGRKELQRPDRDCGKLVWLVRSGNQIALLEARDSEHYIDTFALRDPACKGTIGKAEARSGLFNKKNKFCVGKPIKDANKANIETFTVNPNAIADLRALGNQMANTSFFGIPLGYGSVQTVRLPRSETVPSRFTLEEKRRINVFFVPGYEDRRLTLVRIGE